MAEAQNVDCDDDTAWKTRSGLWQRRAGKQIGGRAKRERQRQPLILFGHGVSMRIEGGSLAIRNGFTHYPQKQEVYRFFKGDLTLPDRIILLDGTGSLSFDVLSWLNEQDVSLIRIDWRGDVVCIASRSGYAANPYRVQWQRETRADEWNSQFQKLLRKSKIQFQPSKNQFRDQPPGKRR